MTFAELAARYRLVAKSRSDGVESWEATRVEDEQAVNVHLLVTTRQISILEMMAHLDPAGRARIVEQLVVDDVPVVVTEPLPPSTTFMEWLQNNVPSTVTSVIRPLSRPKNQQAPQAPQAAQATAPPASIPQSLTVMFLAGSGAASEVSTPAVSPSRPEGERAEPPADVTPSKVPEPRDAPIDAPANEPEVRRVTPPTPLANLAGGLTAMFSASELLSKIDPESTVKRGAVSVPPPATPTPTPILAPTPTPTPTPTPPQTPIVPITEARSTPASPPASREVEPFVLDGGFADDIPDFRSEPIQPARSGHPPARDEDLIDAEPPDFETTFVTPPEPNKAPPKQPQLNPPRPKLGPAKSSYTAVIEGRITPGMPANPALIAPPPPPSRQPSILPVLIVVGLLVLAIAVTIVIVVLKH